MLSDVLMQVADKPQRVPLPEKVRRYFEDHQVPSDIIADLAQCSYRDWVPVGPLDVIPMPQLVDQTSGIAECIKHGLLPVAGCRNFDPVVVDVHTRRVGYISHELLWSDDWSDIQQCLIESPYLYETFWDHALQDPEFPIDSSAAQEVWMS